MMRTPGARLGKEREAVPIKSRKLLFWKVAIRIRPFVQPYVTRGQGDRHVKVC